MIRYKHQESAQYSEKTWREDEDRRKLGSVVSESKKAMLIGKRIRKLREEKKLSLKDIEARTGLLPSYLSRVENGRTVPSLETLDRLAAGLGIHLYQLFYEERDLPPFFRQTRETKRGAGRDGAEQEIRLFERIRHAREKTTVASEDARLAFSTLEKMFSKL